MLSWEQMPATDQSHRRCDDSERSPDWLRQRAWVEIDRSALAANIRQIKTRLSPQTALMAVVKADAYGHGAITVSQTVLEAGAEWLGVATLPEGIELRKAGISAPILILGATYTPEQVRALVHWKLQPTICTPKQALVFAEVLTEFEESLPVHLKIDTGMSRLGTPWQEAIEFVRMVAGLSQFKIASVYSHFATADDRDSTVMNQQNDRFKRVLSQIADAGISIPRLHIANSAATLADSNLHYDMVRVGLAVYGLYPAEHLRGAIDLRPVLQVKARVTQVKTIPTGTGVSYGYKFIADRPTRIAIVGIGYADGVPRNLSDRLKVILRDRLVPQIGAITMDQLILDVSTIPDVEVGEVVTLLGTQGNQHIWADDWATTLGTISWEILCGFKHRLPRIVQ
ncbi:MAG TPA: alanine racemase [Oscillatoriales cyanobacterium M59_W2019_021]|nr:alanine racemase [Oscillatoriales cyanobacterium M4454_W2019_049]HIK50448.1 alanine racemase [Oscillatoriales cyanobacterium M59_W2019_021]